MDNGNNIVVKGRIQRHAHLQWHKVNDLHPSPVAQRNKLNVGKVHKIASKLDLEQLGYPTVNVVNGDVRIIDGWHRVEALKRREYGDQQLQCQTYHGLNEEEEAQIFLMINDTLAVDASSRFRVAVNAGLPTETDIDRIVRANGLAITHHVTEGGIHAPATLVKIYNRAGPAVLSRTLRIIRDAYGTSGLEAVVIDGVALLCARYNNEIVDEKAVQKLAGISGGVKGLIGKAYTIREVTRQPPAQCLAAAAVKVYNSGPAGGRSRIASWWRE